ncbi:MAG TPA: hypothetical protein VKU39_00500 [Streptosporangiaceae bacterium]|nr:hypothetical protein [Streptosporangiaceae bacterium]
MMTQTQALATLEREDPVAAGDAKVALSWLAGDDGLGAITQLRLQEFLWHSLPMKWPLPPSGQVAVARALGRVLLLAGLDRYASVCASADTERIINAYADGPEAGLAAYERATADSNATPPDTDLLAWGSVMGSAERAAYHACGAAIELALVAGELRPGVSGWRTRRVDLVNRWLTEQPAVPAADGASDESEDVPEPWIARISAERIDSWLRGCSGERSRLARAIMPRMLQPPTTPADPLPSLRWLLERAAGGLRLTARHYIAPSLVSEAAEAFGWRDLGRAPRTELDVFPLHVLRVMAQQEMSAVRRSRSSLVLTRTGRLMAADPAVRWHVGTAAVIGTDDQPRPDFPVAVREGALLITLARGTLNLDELSAALTDMLATEGWSAGSAGGLISAVHSELAGLRHRLRALGLLAARDDPAARPLALTEAGVSAALSALLARALRPRHQLLEIGEREGRSPS